LYKIPGDVCLTHFLNISAEPVGLSLHPNQVFPPIRLNIHLGNQHFLASPITRCRLLLVRGWINFSPYRSFPEDSVLHQFPPLRESSPNFFDVALHRYLMRLLLGSFGYSGRVIIGRNSLVELVLIIL